MKTITSFLCAAFIIAVLTGSVSAQVNNKINYQAVARDAGGNLLASHPVSIRVSIRNGAGGPLIYQEQFVNFNTNQFGLFTIQIGGGATLFGTYNTINWAA